MRTMIFTLLMTCLLAPMTTAQEETTEATSTTDSNRAEAYPDPRELPAARDFLGSGVGQIHPEAPVGLIAFGQLAGIWDARQEMRKQDGSWAESAPALWIWKYTLDGFAVQDLWLHSADHLPVYLAALGRAYLLSSLRSFDVASGTWSSTWSANGAGKTGGPDFGTLTGRAEGENIVLSSDSAYGKQRITFSEITEESFLWTNEVSQDGESWTAVMRVHASRRE